MNGGVSGAVGHIAFVTNQLKTHFFARLARDLSAAGVRVSWIATSARWADVARVEGGADSNDILDLSRDGPAWSLGEPPSSDDLALLARVEAAGGLAINDMIIMDRELNRQPWRFGLAYAAAVARNTNAFLAGRGVDLVLGETTWCGELLISQLARLHGAVYAQAGTIRAPSGNFGLLEDVATDRLLTWREPADEHRAKAREFIETTIKTGAKPYYMANKPSPLKWRSHWTKEALVALGSKANHFDPSEPPLRARAYRRLKWAWNSIRANRFAFDTGPSAPDRPYVFITLHLQPEASVDVWGAPFNNQIECIRALARVIPVDHEILVKEHVSAIGCRAIGFYRELARVPGVRLIHFSADTPSLIRRARLVASPAGTACYEAALMGVPAVCFGRVFFGAALVRDGFDPFSMDRASMVRFLADARTARESGELAARAERFLARAIANSHPGRIADATDSFAMADDNMRAVTEGIVAMLGEIGKRRMAA